VSGLMDTGNQGWPATAVSSTNRAVMATEKEGGDFFWTSRRLTARPAAYPLTCVAAGGATVRLAAMSGFAALDASAPGCGIERSSDITAPVRELRLSRPVLQRDGNL